MRYTVHAIANGELTALNKAEIMAATDDYADAVRLAADLIGTPYGCGIMDNENGQIDIGLGFGVPWPDPDEEQEILARVDEEMRDIPDDTPTAPNCDDWGTGEGRYHGRM